jgi:hypothetical protein
VKNRILELLRIGLMERKWVERKEMTPKRYIKFIVSSKGETALDLYEDYLSEE